MDKFPITRSLPIVSIISNPTCIIQYGDQSILTWNSIGAISCSIDNGIGPVSINGSLEVTPPSRTIYTITATNETGSSTSSTKVIAVLKEYSDYMTIEEPEIYSGIYAPYLPVPTFSILPEFFNILTDLPLSLTITPGISYGNIRYTLTGLDPTNTSPIYTGPLTLTTDDIIEYNGWPTIFIKATNEYSGEIGSIAITYTQKLQSGVVVNPPTAYCVDFIDSTSYYTMSIHNPVIDSGTYYSSIVTPDTYTDSMDSTGIYSIEVLSIIDSGNYYESIITPVVDTYTDDSVGISDPVIDSGNYWKSIIEE